MKKAVFMVCLAVAVWGAHTAQSMINPWIECGSDNACGAQKAVISDDLLSLVGATGSVLSNHSNP